jgi:hypothetical protein
MAEINLNYLLIGGSDFHLNVQALFLVFCNFADRKTVSCCGAISKMEVPS